VAVAVVKVSAKGAVQLSKEVRRKTGIKAGDRLVQVADGDQIVMFREGGDPLKALKSIIKVPPGFDVDAWLAEERASWDD
jgi:AbrB family looped-hinge helix DNA binding protein